ncbi:agmatinase family protein [bacterium]|jgi:agmatinase|nr:agmatinase family protein [bacterium]
MSEYNPSDVGRTNTGIFGLPHNEPESGVICIPVPWDVTTSDSSGTATGPQAILDASPHLDLYHPLAPKGWEIGIVMRPEGTEWQQQNRTHRIQAERVFTAQEGGTSYPEMTQDLNDINQAGDALNEWVHDQVQSVLDESKIPFVIGGDHSVSFGAIQAAIEDQPDLGVLQIDAHMDLRESYAGMTNSHASVMANIVAKTDLKQLTQIGVRDYCEEEVDFAKSHQGRLTTFFDRDIKSALLQGEASWSDVCQSISNTLPKYIYITLDIDGLNPSLCPNTGTPVPGGVDWGEFTYLVELLVQKGHVIVAGDVVEVTPGKDSDWDGNVGARAIYQLAIAAALSQKKLS